jgi:hypothetical protein
MRRVAIDAMVIARVFDSLTRRVSLTARPTAAILSRFLRWLTSASGNSLALCDGDLFFAENPYAD